ncbi:MAG: hypothetical protein QM730_22980 [Anaerolineales bacterium]
MTGLKRSFVWLSLYLALVLILGQSDYAGRPILNFASYFYLTVMAAVPITLFFPSIAKAQIPMFLWGAVYLVILKTVDRSISTTSIDLPIIVLEFILLELGVWIAQQLATEMRYAESLMDTLAFGAFPNRVRDIEAESQRIKVELTRSRRYQRPLSLLMIEVEADLDQSATAIARSIQHDLMHRFSFARVGQVIDDLIRQTDLFLKDHRGRYVILCSETSLSDVELFANRISQAVKEKTGLRMFWGYASFPDEALTFEDLMQKARERLISHPSYQDDAVFKNVFKDVSKL